MTHTLQQRVFDDLGFAATDTLRARLIGSGLMLLIAVNVLAVILETVPSIAADYRAAFYAFELFSVVVFSIEYLLRLWVCPLDPRYARPWTGRLRYLLSPMALLDLAAILPFYLPFLIKLDLRFLRALRLFRLFRLFKAGRYSTSLALFGQVAREKREELVISAGAVLLVLVFAVLSFSFS